MNGADLYVIEDSAKVISKEGFQLSNISKHGAMLELEAVLSDPGVHSNGSESTSGKTQPPPFYHAYSDHHHHNQPTSCFTCMPLMHKPPSVSLSAATSPLSNMGFRSRYHVFPRIPHQSLKSQAFPSVKSSLPALHAVPLPCRFRLCCDISSCKLSDVCDIHGTNQGGTSEPFMYSMYVHDRQEGGIGLDW